MKWILNGNFCFYTDNVFNLAQLSLNYFTCGATSWSNYIGITRIFIELNYIPKSRDKLLCLVLLVGAVGIKISVATDEVRRDRF